MHSLRYKQMGVCLSTEKGFKPTSTPVEWESRWVTQIMHTSELFGPGDVSP
jgi:hypothetical protein